MQFSVVLYLAEILEGVGRLVFAVAVDVPRAPVGVREGLVTGLDEKVVVRNHPGTACARDDVWKDISMRG